MPGGDGTGPLGMGPMTGRTAGFCAGYAMPGYANPFVGGFGRGRGRGRGFRNWYYATGLTGWQRAGMGAFGAAYVPPMVAPMALSREQELDVLQAQADHFAGALEEIKGRIAEREASKDEK